MNIKDVWFWIVYGVIVWVLFSVTASAIKGSSENCGKVYPIDYVVYTNLFCEVKK